MTIFEKLVALHPTLTPADFRPMFGFIQLQNDSDGRGDYISAWTHPVYARPTSDQLAESNQNEELA